MSNNLYGIRRQVQIGDEGAMVDRQSIGISASTTSSVLVFYLHILFPLVFGVLQIPVHATGVENPKRSGRAKVQEHHATFPHLN